MEKCDDVDFRRLEDKMMTGFATKLEVGKLKEYTYEELGSIRK